MTPLSTATSGSFLTIERIDAENDDAIRLKRIGICVGRDVQLIQLGDPLILRVVGARIGINRRLAETIQVVPSPNCPPESESNAKSQSTHE